MILRQWIWVIGFVVFMASCATTRGNKVLGGTLAGLGAASCVGAVYEAQRDQGSTGVVVSLAIAGVVSLIVGSSIALFEPPLRGLRPAGGGLYH